jgi:hypothetical protein
VALILAAVPGKVSGAPGAPSEQRTTPEVEYSYYAIGGAEWDGQSGSFVYLGAGAERPLSGDERYSLNSKLFYGELEYKFDSLGKELTAEVEILTVLGGISFKKDRYVLGAGAGVDLRKTERELGAGGTETDNETGLSVQVEASLWGDGKLALSSIASYSTIDDFFWARGRAKKGVYEMDGETDLNLGVELIGMGNSDFSSVQAGVIAELYNNPSKLSVLVKGGIKKSSDLSSTGYAGIELYKGF